MKLYYLMAVEGRRPNTGKEVEERRCSYQLGQAELSRLSSDSSNWMEELAGSVLKDRGGPSEEIKS